MLFASCPILYALCSMPYALILGNDIDDAEILDLTEPLKIDLISSGHPIGRHCDRTGVRCVRIHAGDKIAMELDHGNLR
jgi:hypothetical protein